jgi:hypothetical protein
MIIDQSDKALFNFFHLGKRILVGMICPLIIFICFAIQVEDWTFYAFCALFLIFMSPFCTWISAYIIFRCRYTLLKLSINEEDRRIEITYFNYTKEQSLTADISDIEVKFRRDQSTVNEYYVLGFYHQGKLILRQYEEGEWENAVFFGVVKGLSEYGVKSTFDSIVTRQKVWGQK